MNFLSTLLTQNDYFNELYINGIELMLKKIEIVSKLYLSILYSVRYDIANDKTIIVSELYIKIVERFYTSLIKQAQEKIKKKITLYTLLCIANELNKALDLTKTNMFKKKRCIA